MLSPTPYIMYTSDAPEPPPPSKLSPYAEDNVIQNIQLSYNAAFMAARTIRAASANDDFKCERKTASNYTKEKLLSVARTIHDDVVVLGRVIRYVPEVTVLGLKLTRAGFARQSEANRGKGIGVLRSLRRFRSIPWRHKRQLFKSLIWPVLEYPAVSLHAGS